MQIASDHPICLEITFLGYQSGQDIANPNLPRSENTKDWYPRIKPNALGPWIQPKHGNLRYLTPIPMDQRTRLRKACDACSIRKVKVSVERGTLSQGDLSNGHQPV